MDEKRFFFNKWIWAPHCIQTSLIIHEMNALGTFTPDIFAKNMEFTFLSFFAIVVTSHSMTHAASISVASITMYTNQLSECVLPEIEWNAHCSVFTTAIKTIYIYTFFCLFKRDRNECTFLGSALFICCYSSADRSTLGNTYEAGFLFFAIRCHLMPFLIYTFTARLNPEAFDACLHMVPYTLRQ